MRRPVLLAALALISAGAAPLSAQDYYGDIRPLLTQKCVGCHTEDGIAWSMRDAEEAFRRRRQIAGMILDRKMPPWLAEGGHQQYQADMSLSAETVEMVRRWRDAGLPKGDPRPDPTWTAMGHSFQPELSLDIMPGASYLPDQESDDEYRCFVVDWTPETLSYVTGFRVRPGNRQVSHHTVVYAVEPGMADRFKELSDGEEGLGYQCFGGAIPDRLGRRAEREAYEARYPQGVRELNRAHHWLAHWAPGMDGHVFPEGTGLKMEPGSALVVQMHYYTKDAPGEVDTHTLLDFQTKPTVERPAIMYQQTRGEWLAGERNGSMVIPAGEMATYAVADGLEGVMRYAAAVTGVEEASIQALEIYSANLHMHAFGHSGIIALTNNHGRRETLLSVPRWDLRWQRDFTFDAPKVIARDDLKGASLSVQCTFSNDTEQTVYGGYGSFDEMCFNFSYIAVRTGDAATPAGSGSR